MHKRVFEDPTRFTQLKFYVQDAENFEFSVLGNSRDLTWPIAHESGQRLTKSKYYNSKVLILQGSQKSKY